MLIKKKGEIKQRDIITLGELQHDITIWNLNNVYFILPYTIELKKMKSSLIILNDKLKLLFLLIIIKYIKLFECLYFWFTFYHLIIKNIYGKSIKTANLKIYKFMKCRKLLSLS